MICVRAPELLALPLLVMQLTKVKAAAATSISSHTDADDASRTGVSGFGGPVDLPLHLTEKILYGISPLASARLATVCKSWAAIVSDRLNRPAPHLFVYLPADHRLDRRGVVVSVSLESSSAGGHPPAAAIPCRVRLKDTNHLRCVGAMPASGRLAFANYSWCKDSVLLVNPITGARRRIDVGRLRGNPVVPSGGGADSFVPIAIDELVLWRRRHTAGGAGGGEEWSKSTVQDGSCRTDAIMSVASCNGRFYMLDRDGDVFVVDAGAPPPLRVKKLPAASLFGRLAPPHPALVTGYGYLVGSDDGEVVLFVRRVLAYIPGVEICDHRADELLSVAGFEVYRLDAEGRRWTEVRELPGGRALFVSPASSFAVRSSETEGCRSNCIYFVDKRRHCYSCHKDDGITWGVYSMEDRQLSFKQTVTEPGPCTSATWFLPRVA